MGGEDDAQSLDSSGSLVSPGISAGPSITESMLEDYDAFIPMKCPYCLNSVVPVESRVSTWRQCVHGFCCCFCLSRNRCGCKEFNESLANTALVCPRCRGVIATEK